MLDLYELWLNQTTDGLKVLRGWFESIFSIVWSAVAADDKLLGMIWVIVNVVQ